MDEAADEIDRLREWNEEAQSRASISELAIRRLAEQDATLSVVGGAVQVTMDATLTDAERMAIREAADAYALFNDDADCERIERVLRGLLERTKRTASNNFTAGLALPPPSLA